MSIDNDDCESTAKGAIRFYDNYVPTLEVGDYLINVTQQMNASTSPAIAECYSASQAFSVQGPRYNLPAGDLFSLFPPANAQGLFHQYLPHVVLSKRELPWERNIFSDGDKSKQTPWMALLLFVEGEELGGQPALLDPQIAGWKPNQNKTATITADQLYSHPSGDGILWPNLNREWYETDDWLQNTACSIIEISPQAFATFLASKEDLRFLAHARQVDPTGKDTQVLQLTRDGWYSVVLGNRLGNPPEGGPGQPGLRNIAHLVSLEGFAPYISTGVNQTALPQGTTRVRLISLVSWSFTCLAHVGEDFSELMKGLLWDADGNKKPTAFLLPADPPLFGDDVSQYAYSTITKGYVPLRYETRLGEQTFGWYRGPFCPVPVADFTSAMQQESSDPAGWQPFNTASSALIYDKEYGIFDVSYAVAWETGRLLALANSYFSQELLDWRRKGHKVIDLILERKKQITALRPLNPDNPDPASDAVEKQLLDQIQPYAMTGAFMAYLITQLSNQLAPNWDGNTHSITDPAFPPYPDMPSPPANPQTIGELLQETDVQKAVRAVGGQELDSIADWLAQLYLLVDVPFEDLVPHAGMLPPESIRFFYLDPNWIAALIEGALSIGMESSRDRLYQDLMKDLIWDSTLAAVQQLRDRLLGTLASKTPSGSSLPFDRESLTGMLLRSAVVSGWPGLQIEAFAFYTKDADGNAHPDESALIPLLRMERLSPDVLLCLWPTVPAVVTIEEPHEGVAFGFEDPPYTLYLRSVGSDYGSPKEGLILDATPEINDQHRTIKITGSGGLVEKMAATLPNNPTINVRDFAVEMIKVPERAVFAGPSSGPGSSAKEQ